MPRRAVSQDCDSMTVLLLTAGWQPYRLYYFSWHHRSKSDTPFYFSSLNPNSKPVLKLIRLVQRNTLLQGEYDSIIQILLCLIPSTYEVVICSLAML